MERGANTFPFRNLLPYSESNEGLFLYFLPSLNWIKEKSVATLAIRTFAIQKSQSQFTVLQPSSDQARFPTSPMVIMPHYMLQRISMSSFKPHKSTMVNIQSNFIIFGQHQYFEVIFI